MNRNEMTGPVQKTKAPLRRVLLYLFCAAMFAVMIALLIVRCIRDGANAHPEKLIVMWTIRTADNYKTALDTADNIIFECNDKNADYISTDKARSFLADKTE